MKDYANHLAEFEKTGVWKPLEFPASWDKLPPHPDSIEGINRLRTRYSVVAMSNAPMHMMIRMSKNAGIIWDGIIPLELRYVFKPNGFAFRTLWDCFRTPYGQNIMMISANKDFGDIEAARELGLSAMLIRNPGCPQTIIELAEQLGC